MLFIWKRDLRRADDSCNVLGESQFTCCRCLYLQISTDEEIYATRSSNFKIAITIVKLPRNEPSREMVGCVPAMFDLTRFGGTPMTMRMRWHTPPKRKWILMSISFHKT